MNIKICFDLDGTIVDLYGVDNWLSKLKTENPLPYIQALPLVRLCTLARQLNKLQTMGATICIISWLSKNSSTEYKQAVTQAKIDWLTQHMPSVNFDEINIIPYGTPKEIFCESPYDILFDDEEENRNNWNGIAYDEKNILKILKNLLTNN